MRQRIDIRPARNFRKKQIKVGHIHVPWYWAAPAIIMALLMRYLTVAAGGYYAFTDWNGISLEARFIGLENFREIFLRGVGLSTLWTTVKYAVGMVVISNLLGIVFAVALEWGPKTKKLLRLLLFLPVIMLPMAVSFTWRFVYQYKGPLNALLRMIGLGSFSRTWLADKDFSFFAILLVVIWRWAGRCMLIYLAGLQNISDDVQEAATIDGASGFQRFRHITLPLLAPSMTISFTLTLTAGLNIFDEIKALTDGGPGGLTESLSTLIYTETYVFGHFGYGAALSLVLTICVTIVALAQLSVLRKREKEMN